MTGSKKYQRMRGPMIFEHRDDLDVWLLIVAAAGWLDLACHFQAALDGVAEDDELVAMTAFLWQMLDADNLPAQGRVSAQRIMDELMARFTVERTGQYLKISTRQCH